MEPRVISYARYSSLGQREGTSLARQAEYAAEWAAANEMKLDEELQDEALSAYHGKHVKHGALGKFLKDIEEGKVPPGSVLVVEALDRLSRAEPTEAQALLTQIIHAGVTVHTAKDKKTYSRASLKKNPMDLLYSVLLFIRGNEESENKARHTRDAIRTRCKAWIAGARDRSVPVGEDPAWIHVGKDKRAFIPDRIAAVRMVIDLYLRGYGAQQISNALNDLGIFLTSRGNAISFITRLVRNRALVGEKTVTVNDPEKGMQTFVLQDYYPAVISVEQWEEMQHIATSRIRARSKGTIPHIVTGMGIARCGYCGCAFIAQIRTAARNAKGLIPDGMRRLRCAAHMSSGTTCSSTTVSVQAVLVERAIVEFCSDMLNLRSLFGGDREAAPRATLTAARERLEQIDTEIAAVTSLSIKAEIAGRAVDAYIQHSQQLQEEKRAVEAEVQTAERELARVARREITGLDEKWAKLVKGVLNQETEPRLAARMLVQDTFEAITIYMSGFRPDETPAGVIDIELRARGGLSRMLSIDGEGRWKVVGEDYISQETLASRRKIGPRGRWGTVSEPSDQAEQPA